MMRVVELLVEQLEIETNGEVRDEGAREEKLSSLFRQLREMVSSAGHQTEAAAE